MQSLTRRRFLETSSTAAVGTAFATMRPYERLDAWAARSDMGALDEVAFQKLALQAVDAAKRAGATYADVRITRTVQLSFSDNPPERQILATGVRALVNGYWGFASGPYWTMEEMERLAREAVAQAKISARGKARTVELGQIPPAKGSWTMPVQVDPFSLSWEEILDFMNGWPSAARRYHSAIATNGVVLGFRRMEKTCASTEGSLFTQTTYLTGGSCRLGLHGGVLSADLSRPTAGAGWEYIQEADFYGAIPRLIEECQELATFPQKPVVPGRYPMVFDAHVMTAVLEKTLAPATQLDRALGYEANAGGTSFLNKPLDMLGQTVVAAPSVNITGDRTMRRGVNTVRWDDEGVVPAPFSLVKDGVLTDFQTTREQAAWLTPAYQRRGQPVQSHGCADTDSALDLPMQHTPSLTLQPGPQEIGFDEMVASVKRGFAFIDIKEGEPTMDFQARNGGGTGLIREIINGKLGAKIENAGILFDTTELWKNIIALGGARSRELSYAESQKGEPQQRCGFSVNAVPAAFKEVALVDVTRKA